MLFYDLRPPVANARDLANVGKELVLVVKETPTSAAMKFGKIITALPGEVTPSLCNLADFAECRPIDHSGAKGCRVLAAQDHDDWVQSTSTDASCYGTCVLYGTLLYELVKLFHMPS
jgi:hypothetical protein